MTIEVHHYFQTMELNHASGETDLMSQKRVLRLRQGVKKEQQADVTEGFVLQM
jgi:hypothetical protein